MQRVSCQPRSSRWMRSSNKSRILTNEQKFINNNWTKHTNRLKKLTEFKLKLQKLANLVSFLSRFLCSNQFLFTNFCSFVKILLFRCVFGCVLILDYPQFFFFCAMGLHSSVKSYSRVDFVTTKTPAHLSSFVTLTIYLPSAYLRHWILQVLRASTSRHYVTISISRSLSISWSSSFIFSAYEINQTFE